MIYELALVSGSLPKSYNPTIKTLPIPDKVKQAINNPIMDKSILYPMNEAPIRLPQQDESKLVSAKLSSFQLQVLPFNNTYILPVAV